MLRVGVRLRLSLGLSFSFISSVVLQCGTTTLTSGDYTAQILPHKLSLVVKRRDCLNLTLAECLEDRPPQVDYPRYSSSGTAFSDLVNFDIKVPGEHQVEGQSFDAEIQMTHLHLVKMSARKVPPWWVLASARMA